MTKKEAKAYSHTRVHRLAKLIVAIMIILILDAGFKETIAILVWIFGVNPIAYALESLFKYRHRHRAL